MKKYLLIAFAAIASFTACDFLDRGPLSDMTEEIYFKTAEDLGASVPHVGLMREGAEPLNPMEG